MNRGLEALKRLFIKIKHYDSLDEKVMLENDYSTIESELKDYQEIKEIAKHFNWDDFTSKIFSVETDKKYRDLFNGAIADIQKDYRKAKAFEIIREKQVNVSALLELENLQQYNDYCDMVGGCKRLTKEEYNLLKEAL